MASVTLKEGEDFDCSHTYKQVVNYLPAYARPRFIRIQVKNNDNLHCTFILFHAPAALWHSWTVENDLL